MDGVNWYRGVIILGLSITCLVLICQLVVAYKHLSIGQKLFASGTIFLIIYAVDAGREAIQVELEFRWRLIFLTLSVLSLGAYILEPKASRWKRYGNKYVLKPKKDDE